MLILLFGLLFVKGAQQNSKSDSKFGLTCSLWYVLSLICISKCYELIIQLEFNDYIKLFIIQFFMFFLQMMNNPRKKYFEITEKIGSDEIYALLDEVVSDLDEDVDNEMNDSDT